MPAPTAPNEDRLLARLDEIAIHLEHLDRRDKVRMTWSTVRGVFHAAVALFFIGSSFYLFSHMTEIIQTIAQESAKQAMEYSKAGSDNFLKQLQDYLPKK